MNRITGPSPRPDEKGIRRSEYVCMPEGQKKWGESPGIPMKRGLNDLRVRECKCPDYMGPHNPDEKGVEGLVDLERLKASIMNGSSSGNNPLSSRGWGDPLGLLPLFYWIPYNNSYNEDQKKREGFKISVPFQSPPS